MKTSLLYIFTFLCLTACSEIEDNFYDSKEKKELEGIEAEVYGGTKTRAAALDKSNYVGRSTFAENEYMILTKLRRTDSPIPGFSYTDIWYKHEIGEGQTSGGWNRDNTKGKTYKEGFTGFNVNVPERIYWSDALSAHTYIGYSTPLQAQGTTFDWEKGDSYHDSEGNSLEVYYGSIGDPTHPQEVIDGQITNFIDYTNDSEDTLVIDDVKDPDSPGSYKSGNEKIKHDDLLLTYDDNKFAETGGSVAKLYYKHALSNVRVVVNIQGFSASTDAADSYTVVSNMILKNMLTMYKWKQISAEAEALEEVYDKNNINTIYNNGTDGAVKFDQKKDVHLWIPRPEGTGIGVGKQFTFYGLAVPTTLSANTLEFEFTVKYPDPMNPWKKENGQTIPNYKNHTYTAIMPVEVMFRAGYCTTINISLNHDNEQMTIGAEYMDWQNVDTPDEGELKKHDTFLYSTLRTGVTIANDAGANEDDATWLYKTSSGNVVDIYGNDGTAAKPYTISTADQLLSFAYEVKSGRAFTSQYVKLDADITMQSQSTLPTITVDEVTSIDYTKLINWIGIGDDTHAFNGYFLGGGRNISLLYGKAFFSNIGGHATISELNISNAVRISDHGALAEHNDGFIYACRVDGDVENSTSDYVGSLCGTNTGFVIACTHNGAVRGTKNGAKVGGLLGRNGFVDGSNKEVGIIVASYHTGIIEGTYTYGDVEREYEGSKIYACYYNSSLATPSNTVDALHVQPRTTDQMQSRSFTEDDLNGKITEIIENKDKIRDDLLKSILEDESLTDDQKNIFVSAFVSVLQQYQFVFTPGAYPRVASK